MWRYLSNKQFWSGLGATIFGVAWEARDGGFKSLNPSEWHPVAALAILVGILVMVGAFIPWVKVWKSIISINPVMWSWPVWFELWFRDRRVQLVHVDSNIDHVRRVLTVTFQLNDGTGMYSLECFGLRDGWLWQKAEESQMLVSSNQPTSVRFRVPTRKGTLKPRVRAKLPIRNRYVYSDKFEVDLTDLLESVLSPV